MNKIYIKIFALFLVVGLTSCNIDEVFNPNGPTQESFAEGASQSQLQLLVNGVEDDMRNDMAFYYQTVSIVGREYYDLNGTDPRYTGELLGAGSGAGALDNNGFLTTRSFNARYRTVRNAQILMNSVANSDAGLDDAGKKGYTAFAKTVQAYQLLLSLNRQFNNGVRLDIADPDNLGSFVSYTEGLAGIKSLLESASSDAQGAGGAFSFDLSSGFAGFDSPAGFVQFINALIARVELYSGNGGGALSALSGSFMDMSGDLNTGVYHVFSGSGGDRLNPIYYPPVSDKFMAQNSFVPDAEAGDTRLSKVTLLDDPVAIDDLTGEYQVQVYSSNTAPVAIIRNEELILIAAEANIGSDDGAAVAAINVVRNAAGLGDYTGGMDAGSLVAEVLNQRRYSLFGEGHRWLDMRRTNNLGQLPLDRPGDEVFVEFPRPVLEGN